MDNFTQNKCTKVNNVHQIDNQTNDLSPFKSSIGYMYNLKYI